MRTKLYFVAALAATMLASCADEKFVGENSPNVVQNESAENAILFSTSSKGITRGDIYGNEAAKKLGNNFYVTGTKGTEPSNSPTTTLVFDNYLVHYGANTAGTTVSNTANWEYVGIDQSSATPSERKPENYDRVKLSSITGAQTIKYWDYSVAQYDFFGFSTGVYKAGTTANEGTQTIGVTEMKYGSALASNTTAYTFTIPSITALENAYITDIIEVKKANYGNEVSLKFKNIGSKVRVALYETVPGYAITDVKFYNAGNTPIKEGEDGYVTPGNDAILFSENVYSFPSTGSIAVYFPNVGTDGEPNTQNYNKAAANVTPTAGAKTKAFGTLHNFAASKEGSEPNDDGNGHDYFYIGRTLPTATYAGNVNANYYKSVFPVSTSYPLTLRVDYTLVSVDGSKETIKVYGANAVVPSTYTVWQPNYAYTYIFKISDNTNGWTDQNASAQGLFPITFDAVVAEFTDVAGDQKTITTVATPSITTYQQNHDITKVEYSKATGKDIYVQVMDNTMSPAILAGTGTDPDPVSSLPKLNTNNLDATPTAVSRLYQLSDADATEAKVMDALEKRTTGLSEPDAKGRNGLEFTEITIDNSVTKIEKGVNNNDITPVEAGTAAKISISSLTANKAYAYVYDYTASGKTVINEFQPIAVTGTFGDQAGTYKYLTTDDLKNCSVFTTGSETNADADFYNYVYFSRSTTDGGTTYTYSYVSVADKTTLPAGLVKYAKDDITKSEDKAASAEPENDHFYFANYFSNNGKYAVKVIKIDD